MSIEQQGIEKLDLKRITFMGRTWEDYMNMFSLTEADLSERRILDCPGGAATFTAVSLKMGHQVTACDIAYQFTIDQLVEKGLEDVALTEQLVESRRQNYRIGEGGYYPNIEMAKSAFTNALLDWAADAREFGFGTRYVLGALPNLPFADEQFDLALSGHLLFTYADRLPYEFHIDSIRELMRVTTQEIRMFPLVDYGHGEPYPHLDRVIAWVAEQGWEAEIVEVPYHVHQNANTMLRIVKQK